MRQMGKLKNMTEKSGFLSMKEITKYERITGEVVEIYCHIVQFGIRPYIHIVTVNNNKPV